MTSYINLIVGLAFWKASKRRFYAIPQSTDAESTANKRAKTRDDTDEHLKKRKLDMMTEDMLEIKDIVESLQADVSKLLQVNSSMVLPLGLSRSISELIKCKICHSMPMSPPLIYARCYKSILGCEKCANTWYEGESALIKPCPLCGQDRGYNETQRVLGFDDFAEALKKLFTGDRAEQVAGNE